MNPPNNTHGDAVDLLEKFGGIASKVVRDHSGTPLLLVHQNYRLQSLEEHLPNPARKRSCPTFQDAKSFVRYVNNQKESNSQIFATVGERSAKLTAVLDFHYSTEDSINDVVKFPPNWCGHRAVFELQETVEWKRWIGSDKKKFDQVAFALFLEENELSFVDPKGSTLLELISSLEGKSDVRFNTGIRLQDGRQRITYEEDIVVKGSSGTAQGEMEVPATLTLGIAPFEGCAKYSVKARLRYRIEQRKLTFWYETINPHLIVRDSVTQILNEVTEGTKITPLVGTFA